MGLLNKSNVLYENVWFCIVNPMSCMNMSDFESFLDVVGFCLIFGFLRSPASALEPWTGGLRMETGDPKNPKNQKDTQRTMFRLVNQMIWIQIYSFAY